MNEEELEYFIEAGKISEKILREIPRLTFEGQSILDIAETIEKMIIDNGGQPGFPVNVSVNHYAAHYTPSLGEETVINERDIVKIDFGVSVKGCISDQAVTINLSGENNQQITAVKNALKRAIEVIKPGVKVIEVSKVIEDEITKLGFKPISNLGGHMIRPYLLHAGVFVPNVIESNDPSSKYIFREGDVFAIEPFATTGKTGKVVDTDMVRIFSLKQIKNVRLKTSREVLSYIIENYSTLPFARRWLHKKFGSKVKVNAALRELLKNNILFEYPVLKDADNGIVTQAEATVVVEKEGATPLIPLDLV